MQANLWRSGLIGVVLVLGVLWLAACQRAEHEALAARCQFEACVCAPAVDRDLRARRTSEVIWRDNGDAACRAGFVLRTELQWRAHTVAQRRKAFTRSR